MSLSCVALSELNVPARSNASTNATSGISKTTWMMSPAPVICSYLAQLVMVYEYAGVSNALDLGLASNRTELVMVEVD